MRFRKRIVVFAVVVVVVVVDEELFLPVELSPVDGAHPDCNPTFTWMSGVVPGEHSSDTRWAA